MAEIEVKTDSPETAAEVYEKISSFIETLPRKYQRVRVVRGMLETHTKQGATHCADAMRRLLNELTTNA